MKVYYPTEDEGGRLFTRAGYLPPHEFSDGEETESRLYDIVSRSRDRSIGSAELKSSISDWPSTYHLDAGRANLLRPFASWFAGERVLEIGCGCGAITRFLGESGAEVTAIEPSMRRARIAAQRCAELEHVGVYVDDLEGFDCERLFPFVTAIGVLEYSPLYFQQQDAVEAALRRLLTLLDDRGILFIAIENQLGLRYFNGFAEEHVNAPFYGVHDLYAKGDPVTVGRRKWMEMLCAAGFANSEVYYPFPDYKFTRVVICPDALKCPELDVAHIIGGAGTDRFRPLAEPVFSEAAAWRPIVRNGLMPDLANSFLITASRGHLPRLPDLAYSYSDNRTPEFAAETILQSRSGRVVAAKRKLYPATPAGSHGYEHVTGETPVMPGEIYDIALDKILLKPGWGAVEIAAWALPWYEFLDSHCEAPGLLPADWMDCIPSNLLRRPDGSLQPFDLEYRAQAPVRLDLVLFRGLWSALHARAGTCAPPSVKTSPCIAEEASRIMQLLLPFSAEKLEEVIRLEATFQGIVNGTAPEDEEGWLRHAQFRGRKRPGGTGLGPEAATRVQVFWRSRAEVYDEIRSASERLEPVGGQAIRSRLEIPGGLNLDRLRVDVCDRPALLAGLRIELANATGEIIGATGQDYGRYPVHDMVLLALPEAAGFTLAASLGDDPYLEYVLSAAERDALAGGGFVTVSYTYVETQANFDSINERLCAFARGAAAADEMLKAAHEELSAARGQNEAIAHENACLEFQRRQCSEQLAESRRESLLLKEGLEAAKAALTDLREESRRVWDVVESNEAAITECRRQLLEKDNQLAETKASLQGVLNSLTWRVSKATAGRLVRIMRKLRQHQA